MLSHIALSSLLLLATTPAWSDTLDPEKAALQVIQEFSDHLCNNISLEGSAGNFQLSGKAKAELTGVIKQVTDIGIEGAGKYENTEWRNVLQQDLAKVLEDSRNCRLEVFRALVDRLLPDSAVSANRPALIPIPAHPPPPPNVLYGTGMGTGEFERWSLSPGWSRLKGMLINDGTRGNRDFLPSIAPYRPASADYVVEAEILVIDDGDRNNNSFGIVVRVNNQNGYAVGVTSNGATRICYLSAWIGVGFVGGGSGIRDNKRCRPLGQTFRPDGGWHTYRVEVQTNIIKLLIDDHVMTNVIDNMFTSGGSAGLWSSGYQLQVRHFTIRSLD
jgi:hypothetical protein